MGKEISLSDRKNIQLEMLNEIHSFCNTNGIRYSLAYGTLIGAIRHKGFIPWDDDVDIMMPFPDVLRIKKEFKSNTIKFCDIDTESNYEYPFPRFAHNNTYRQAGKSYRSYGVNIDVYPVINVPDSVEERDLYFDGGLRLLKSRLTFMRLRNKIISMLPLSTIPGFNRSVRNYCNYMFNNALSYGSSNHYFVFGGSLNKKERELCTYNFDLFSTTILVDFEGYQFSAIKKYNEFLTYYYGDYMTPPPIEKQAPYHVGAYYWKDCL